MNNEERWKMYIDIKYLKDKGFSNTAISEITGLYSGLLCQDHFFISTSYSEA